MIETIRDSFYRKKGTTFYKGDNNNPTTSSWQQQYKQNQKPKQKNYDAISIINDYTKKSGANLAGIKKLDNDKHTVWIYSSSDINALWCEEERFHYLIIKKRWNNYYGWSDGRRNLERMGITIPLVVYEFVANHKNYNDSLIVCILNDTNKWMYKEVEKHTYYSITLDDMHKFAKKHYTIFTSRPDYDDDDDDNNNETEVIGFPFSLFHKI